MKMSSSGGWESTRLKYNSSTEQSHNSAQIKIDNSKPRESAGESQENRRTSLVAPIVSKVQFLLSSEDPSTSFLLSQIPIVVLAC